MLLDCCFMKKAAGRLNNQPAADIFI